MYQRTYWKDEVVDQHGTIIQEGTNQDQAHFNNMEEGITDSYLASVWIGWAEMHHRITDETHSAAVDSEILGETKTVTLSNTAKAPFNSTLDLPVSVALSQKRKNLYYSVETSISEHTGEVGDIEISDKALNGFKIAYTGSGKSVTLTLRIKGGMA